MIKEIPCYTVICDNCGADSNEGSEHIGWTDKEAAWDLALDANFTQDGDKHYCEKCYSYDCDDNLTINLERKK